MRGMSGYREVKEEIRVLWHVLDASEHAIFILQTHGTKQGDTQLKVRRSFCTQDAV
jgi:hypothetical protein